MEVSLGLGKKSYGAETDTETQSWFRLPIPKPGFGRTLPLPQHESPFVTPLIYVALHDVIFVCLPFIFLFEPALFILWSKEGYYKGFPPIFE